MRVFLGHNIRGSESHTITESLSRLFYTLLESLSRLFLDI